MQDSRKQFEEWIAKTTNSDLHREIILHRRESGSYSHLATENEWKAWQASREAIASEPVVAYQDHYGNAISAGDFDGGEDEMHETANQEGWNPLILAAGLKIKGE